MNGASLLLAAFKWTLLGRVANPGPLMNGASPLGDEQARGDSPSPPPGPDEAEAGRRGRSTPTLCLLTNLTLCQPSSVLAL